MAPDNAARCALARRRPCPFEIVAGARLQRHAHFALNRRTLGVQKVAFLHGRAEIRQNIVVKGCQPSTKLAGSNAKQRLEALGFGEAGFYAFTVAALLFSAGQRSGANLTHLAIFT